MVVDLFRRVNLLDLPGAHDGDPVRHCQGLALVVGDIDRGDAEIVMQAPDLELHMLAQVLVQGRERFVHQHDPRFVDDRPGQCHALALAAGQGGNVAVRKCSELHAFECRHGPVPDVTAGQLAQFQRVFDVFPHGHMRKQGVVLEHDADVALVGGEPGHVAISDHDPTRFRARETGNGHQQCGLA